MHHHAASANRSLQPPIGSAKRSETCDLIHAGPAAANQELAIAGHPSSDRMFTPFRSTSKLPSHGHIATQGIPSPSFEKLQSKAGDPPFATTVTLLPWSKVNSIPSGSIIRHIEHPCLFVMLNVVIFIKQF